MTSIFTVVKGQQKHRYTRSTNARLSKNILVTVRKALFRIKTYTTSAFPKIPVTNITIKMIGTTRSAMMLFSVFIVDQCSKDKLKCPKKEAFWFIPACSPDITQEMLVIGFAESSCCDISNFCHHMRLQQAQVACSFSWQH